MLHQLLLLEVDRFDAKKRLQKHLHSVWKVGNKLKLVPKTSPHRRKSWKTFDDCFCTLSTAQKKLKKERWLFLHPLHTAEKVEKSSMTAFTPSSQRRKSWKKFNESFNTLVTAQKNFSKSSMIVFTPSSDRRKSWKNKCRFQIQSSELLPEAPRPPPCPFGPIIAGQVRV